jgi:hypothetical protein
MHGNEFVSNSAMRAMRAMHIIDFRKIREPCKQIYLYIPLSLCSSMLLLKNL